MDKIQQALRSKKIKHTFFIALVAIMVGWVIFRFIAFASENARFVYNASRVASENGLPVEYVIVHIESGTLYEPLSVKNNRAYVSGERASKMRAGQKIENGKITFVSNNIDLNTGMYLVRTSGVSDGLHFAEFTTNGIFVPLYAISDNSVFVADNGIATKRNIKIARQDSENAYVESGLNSGDVVILSKVQSGVKVKLNK
ncbi:MAG: hypothetical protein UIC65_00960 [Alphaproteobacteria bacterium]|nr:hypothetical protein [Alphaproteobacteria bacterium]